MSENEKDNRIKELEEEVICLKVKIRELTSKLSQVRNSLYKEIDSNFEGVDLG